MKKVEDLDVFKLSHSLTLEIFELTNTFPEGEKFGLISQMRRAAYSIPMNLMEGAHRLSSEGYQQYPPFIPQSNAPSPFPLLI